MYAGIVVGALEIRRDHGIVSPVVSTPPQLNPTDNVTESDCRHNTASDKHLSPSKTFRLGDDIKPRNFAPGRQ